MSSSFPLRTSSAFCKTVNPQGGSPVPRVKVTDKVRFTYDKYVMDGVITHLKGDNTAVIRAENIGVLIVPVKDIVRVL